MTGMRHVVECYDNQGQLVHCSESRTFDTLAAPAPCPPNDALINEAKTELTNERKAFPPYDGFEFRIRHERF
jgi:hypothetical protein